MFPGYMGFRYLLPCTDRLPDCIGRRLSPWLSEAIRGPEFAKQLLEKRFSKVEDWITPFSDMILASSPTALVWDSIKDVLYLEVVRRFSGLGVDRILGRPTWFSGKSSALADAQGYLISIGVPPDAFKEADLSAERVIEDAVDHWCELNDKSAQWPMPESYSGYYLIPTPPTLRDVCETTSHFPDSIRSDSTVFLQYVGGVRWLPPGFSGFIASHLEIHQFCDHPMYKMRLMHLLQVSESIDEIAKALILAVGGTGNLVLLSQSGRLFMLNHSTREIMASWPDVKVFTSCLDNNLADLG